MEKPVSLSASTTNLFLLTGATLKSWIVIAFAVLALALSGVTQAQQAYLVSYGSSVVYSSASVPAGVAVDANGNLYIADYSNNQVLLETLQANGTYVQSTIGTGFLSPSGVAVDALGNVYIADTGNGRVVKEEFISAGNYSQVVIMASGNAYIAAPTGIAVASNGNVYVSDPNKSNVIRLASGKYTVTLLANSATGLIVPEGVVADSYDNVFIADTDAGVIEVPTTCTLPATSACKVVIGTSIASPNGVGVDAQDNIYISSYSGTGGQVFKETLISGGTYSQTTLATNLPQLNGIAVDSKYDFYVSTSSPDQVLEFSPTNVNFGNVSVGATSSVLTLNFIFTSGGSIGSIQAVERGAVGADFAVAPGGTCLTGTVYAAGSTCTVNVTFTPLYPGTRFGAIEFMTTDAVPRLFAQAYVYGTGLGPQVVFLPGIENYNFGNLGTQATVAVDGNDNIFATSSSNPIAYEYTAASGYSNAIVLPGNYTTLSDINTDGAGDVYLTSSSAGICYKLIAADNFNTIINVETGVTTPQGSTVDGQGNIFVAGKTFINEILAANNYSQIVQIYAGTTGIADIAVDGRGNLFILYTTGGGYVDELLAVNGAVPANAQPVKLSLDPNFHCCNNTTAIKADAEGNIYISDHNQGVVYEYYVSTNFTTGTVVFPFQGASGVAVDSQGNIWATSNSLNYIGALTTATAPTEYFNATTVGNTSTDSPKTVYIENIGNEPLALPVSSTGLNPSISVGFTWTATGTTYNPSTQTNVNNCPVSSGAGYSIGQDVECAFPISFTPVYAGDTTGSLVLTDNDFNTSNSAQTIYLNGTGNSPTMTVTADSYTIGTNGPAPNYQYTLDGPLGSTSCTGTPAISSALPAGPPYPMGTYTITITQGKLKCTAYTHYKFVNGTITVGKNQAVLTLTTTNATMQYGMPVPNLSGNYTLTGFQGTDTQASSCTGAPNITTVATSTSSPGTYAITAAPGSLVCTSTNYNYSFNVVNTGVLTITKDTPTINWTPSPVAILSGTGLVASQLNAQVFDNTTNVSADGTFVYKYGTTVVSVGYVLPLGPDSICVTWTPLAAYNADFNTATMCNTIYVETSLKITANNVGITYGATPAFNYTSNPATMPSGCTGTVTYSLSPVPAYTPDPVGSYTITPAGITCTYASGYLPVYVTGSLTVSKDAPTVTYSNASIPYGTALSSIAVTAVNSNNSTNVLSGGTLSYTWAGTSEPATFIPPYGTGQLCVTWTPNASLISGTSLAYSSEYSATTNCQNITVTQGLLTITATPGATAVYGSTLPNSTYTYVITGFVGNDGSGFLGNDGPSGATFGGSNVVCSGAPVLSTPVDGQTNPYPSVGIYTVGVSTTGFACTGYLFKINTGELHITPATLTIQPVAVSQSYDSQVPTYQYQCLLNGTLLGTNNCGAGVTAVTGTPGINATATIRASSIPGVVYYTSNVGTYSLKASLGSLKSATGDYTFSFQPNTLTLTTSPQSLTVQPYSITMYQSTCLASGVPAPAYKITGLLNWDTQASTTTGAPVLSIPTYTGNCAKGTYTIQSATGTLALDVYNGQTDYSGIIYGTATLTIK